MTDKARITIAAVITALFLGALSAAGALTHSNLPAVAASTIQAPAVARPAPPAAISSPC